MNPLAVIGLGIAAYYFLSKSQTASAVDKMRFLLSSVKVTFSGLSPRLNLDVLIQNPTNETVVVKAIAGDVKVNGTKVGAVSSFQTVTIKPVAETTATLIVVIPLAGVATQIINLISGNIPGEAVVNIIGTVNVNGAVVPLDITYKIV
jgi:LEA14-like dessication related protein